MSSFDLNLRVLPIQNYLDKKGTSLSGGVLITTMFKYRVIDKSTARTAMFFIIYIYGAKNGLNPQTV